MRCSRLLGEQLELESRRYCPKAYNELSTPPVRHSSSKPRPISKMPFVMTPASFVLVNLPLDSFFLCFTLTLLSCSFFAYTEKRFKPSCSLDLRHACEPTHIESTKRLRTTHPSSHFSTKAKTIAWPASASVIIRQKLFDQVLVALMK